MLKIEAQRLALTLAPLEARLGLHDYILPSGFSGADTMLGYNLRAAPHYVRLDPFPNIRAYIATDRGAARLSKGAGAGRAAGILYAGFL